MTRIWEVQFGNTYDCRNYTGKDVRAVLEQAKVYQRKLEKEVDTPTIVHITSIKLLAEAE